MKRQVCVTGGFGFIGSHIARAFYNQGYRVVVLDDLSTGDPARLADIDFVYHDCDVADLHQTRRYLMGSSVIVHTAAKVSVEESFKNESAYRETNYWGTRNVVDVAVEYDVPKLIYLSTCAVYGRPTHLPVAEHHRINPQSPYAETKMEGEVVVRTADLESAYVLRLSNVYGPEQATDSALIARFCDAESLGIGCTVHGDGSQRRDFCFVGDVCKATLACTGHKGSGVYNIGFGRSYSVLDVYHAVVASGGRRRSTKDFILGSVRKRDIRDIYLDITKAQKELRWVPTVDLRKGIRQTLRAYQARWGSTL
jgi:UDP-glucose 4-epimerase